MKKLAIVALLAVGCFLAGCGTSTTPLTQNAGGNWEATLVGENAGINVFNFVTTFTVTNSGVLQVSYLGFLTTGPCFALTGEQVGGNFTITSAADDPTATANVTFTVQGASLLSMTGTALGTTNTATNVTTWTSVTGTWTLTGGNNCAGTGTFTMCPNAETCSTT